MNFRSEIEKDILASIETKKKLLTDTEAISASAEMMIETLQNGGKLIFCGNGGSAADAQHIATEYMVRLRSSFQRPSIPAIALTTNTSLLTAAANDFGYEEIFSRQIESLGKKEDVLIAISTSGNSENIMKAVKAAKENGMKVIGWLGKTGGELKAMVDCPICVPHADSGRIQESHIMIGHITCRLVEESLFPQQI